MQKLLSFSIISLFSFHIQCAYAQQPKKPSAVEIYNQIEKLNFLGSVLYIAAHPDDENTRLISYLSNHIHARTGYLSLTRGDGGQNLIGPELRELLGVIRTQELIEARKIDGGEQFFTRANDFGYSKTPDETLTIWEKEKVLADVVWAIRKFRPDVIINRFDARTPGTTHGHHTASAMLSLEGFDKAANLSAYPEQLNLIKPWQPKRVFFNTSFWFYGGKDKFDKADKTNLYNFNIGTYYKSIGKSNQEIAALSRSRHQSQGFGSTGTRGEETEYLEFIKGEAPKDRSNLFDGIDTSWNRVKNGAAIGILLGNVKKNFNFENPSASIPELAKAYQMIQQLDDDYWREIKSDEVRKIIGACAGLYLEAVAEKSDATPGSTVKIKLEAINRSDILMDFQGYTVLPAKNREAQTYPIPVSESKLLNNISQIRDAEIKLTEDINYTQPYWLKDKASVGMYQVNDQKKIGLPDVIREMKISFEVNINGVVIPFERDVIYKYNDDVKGEVYEPFDIVPDVTTSIMDKVNIFTRKTKTINVKVKAGKENVSGNVKLELPANWQIFPFEIPFALTRKGEEQIVTFEITAPKTADEISAKCVAVIGGNRFDHELTEIHYPHISKQMVLKPSEAKFIKLDIKTGDEKIAYIMGAGDEVNKSLIQMGYDVTIIKPEEITKEKLAEFDVVITGIRAYNTVNALAVKQQILLDFVHEGKTMIVQYNTTDDIVTKDIAPYPLKISRDRVTEENAEVRFLAPENRLLNHPNKITAKDFQGWKQEQGLYYPNEWDKAFTPVLSANDKGEKPKDGALLVATYGKGHYIYTGLSFFRELPEGVSGAFRLMANMISIGN
jgi:LmbE family N-acetylglucosaminyl deacetylase